MLDFGYPWWLSYGHIVILMPALALLWIGRGRHWGKWTLMLLGALAVWSVAAMISMRAFNAAGRGTMPTQNFFTAGKGRVLDIGAGTGRSSIMLLEARPQATLVALDQFGDSFDHHFGHGKSGQEWLRGNLKVAGVEQRVTIETADMRKLPFEAASFDAVISAYAVDHLSRDGSRQTLVEAARVLKPRGDFLLMLVHNDAWVKFAFGPLLSHGGTRSRNWWQGAAEEAGFKVAEEGTAPATLYFVLRRL